MVSSKKLTMLLSLAFILNLALSPDWPLIFTTVRSMPGWTVASKVV